MYQIVPVEEAERLVKEAHDSAGKYTKPVLRRYPLLFSFLTVFSVASIAHGFELLTDQYDFFTRHPSALISIGVILLFAKGTLYKVLEKKQR